MEKQINILETLDWYIWAGVTETVADSPCLASSVEIKESTAKEAIAKNKIEPAPSKPQTKPFVSVETQSGALKNAKELCLKASTIEELKELLNNFDGCRLKDTAASTILGEGSLNAKLMLIGEAPGADEDRQGRPFVGKCGKLLEKMLAAINLTREECYITNVQAFLWAKFRGRDVK